MFLAEMPFMQNSGSTSVVVHQKLVDKITDSSRPGTKVLQVLLLADYCEDGDHGVADICGWILQELCGGVGGRACRSEEEGLGCLARCV
jgi:hypothetical protein